jgi:hypothetical protein
VNEEHGPVGGPTVDGGQGFDYRTLVLLVAVIAAAIAGGLLLT